MTKHNKSVCEPKHFEALFNMHSTLLINYIYYKCGDFNLAEDMVQEAFILLWNNCEKVNYDEALFYLKRVANNNFLNSVKHQKVVLNYKKFKGSGVNNESPEFLFEEKEFMKKLQDAIAILPEKQREVFLLNRIDKMTYKEIAALLNLSVKAVEKRMHNALVVLREKLGNI